MNDNNDNVIEVNFFREKKYINMNNFFTKKNSFSLKF